jgi:oxalate decarboxylase/phosphoglucose isomerase-like protein (cupin superfamily)
MGGPKPHRCIVRDKGAAMTISPLATESPVFDLAHMPIDPDSGPGGTVQIARAAQFPFMTGASIARVAMDANAARAAHWHVNSWEIQFCAAGACKLSVVNPDGVLSQGIITPGLAGFAPQGWLHTLETVGNESCILYLCWGDSNVQTQEMAQSIGQVPAEVVAGTLGITVAEVKAFNTTKRLMTKNA